jgi:hypothetical protein
MVTETTDNVEPQDGDLITPAELAKELGVTSGLIYAHIKAFEKAEEKAIAKGEEIEDPFPGVRSEKTVVTWKVRKTDALKWLQRREERRAKAAADRAAKFTNIGASESNGSGADEDELAGIEA